jgi:thioesterase domain-containing protein
MAQQLTASGEKVAFLALIECADPHHPGGVYGKARFGVERLAWKIKKQLSAGPKKMMQWAAGHVKSVGESAAIRAKRTEAKLLKKELPELPEVEVDIYEKARRTVDRYELKDYNGKTVVFIGKDTYAYCGLSKKIDPRLMWCELSKGGSEIKIIRGDHMDMLEAPIVNELAEELKSCLEQSRVANT